MTSHPLQVHPRHWCVFSVDYKASQSHSDVGITDHRWAIVAFLGWKCWKLTWYLHCFWLCLNCSVAFTVCESASFFQCDFKLLTLLVKTFSTACCPKSWLHNVCIVRLIVFSSWHTLLINEDQPASHKRMMWFLLPDARVFEDLNHLSWVIANLMAKGCASGPKYPSLAYISLDAM